MAQRARTWVVDLRHYLDDETGDLADMPGPALRAMAKIKNGLKNRTKKRA